MKTSAYNYTMYMLYILIPEATHEALESLYIKLWFSLLVRKTELVVSQVATISHQ